jgi:endonuclease V-like protein UPF0215 family
MNLFIRSVKKEIRILGLDTCRTGEVFGVIVRGGLFLDGVVRFPLADDLVGQELARAIVSTRYYPELRAIMLHDPKQLLSPETLENRSRLPIIEIARERQARKGYVRFRANRKTLFHRTRLPRETVEEILALTWTHEGFPEPVRVAHLLASSKLEPLHPSSRQGHSASVGENMMRKGKSPKINPFR